MLSDRQALFIQGSGRIQLTLRIGHIPQVVAAHTWLSESLKTAWELDDKVVVFSSLEFLAWLAYSRGEGERAARLYGAADVLRKTFGYTLSPSDQNKPVVRTTDVRAALGDAAFTAAWEKGSAMAPEQIVEDALA